MNRTCTQILTLLPAVVFALAAAACQDRGAAAPDNPALRSLVDSSALESAVAGPRMTKSERARLTDQVRRFYAGQGYQLIWTDGKQSVNRLTQLVKVLESAPDHGLPPDLYTIPPVDSARESGRDSRHVSPERLAEFDVKASAALFRYFLHLTGGRLDPHALEPLWTLKPQKADLVAALTSAVKKDDLVAAMNDLQPAQPGYRALQQALMRYRAVAAKGGWPSIPPATRVKPGQHTDVLPALGRRLAMEGDLDPAHENDSDSTFSGEIVEAVKRFQERHRLKADGILAGDTVKALNVSVEQRIRTIELNLERWRWLPDTMPDRYLIVNVPDFRLEAIENHDDTTARRNHDDTTARRNHDDTTARRNHDDTTARRNHDGTTARRKQERSVLDTRVVVGAPDNKTPIFADEMTEVVFSPYWNVPSRIAEEETIPRAASDAEFLVRNNMEVVETSGKVVDPALVDWTNTRGLRIRQRPGDGNALGGVKFIFPNTFYVYLHDTNATALFNRLERGLSHGCVRVEEPLELAQYVLRDQPEWTPEAIGTAMKSGDEKHVKLKAAIPVFILYKTAWVHDGGVRFLKDLYGYDADQSAQLWPVEANVRNEAARR